MKSKNLNKLLSLCLGVLVLSVVVGFTILAWTEPTVAPTGGNVSAPLNTGSTAQTKAGAIGWGTAGAVLNTDQGASIELRGSGAT